MDIRKKQRMVVEALEDVKGRDIVVYNTARMPSMFERVVIASGESNRQVRALADRVQEKVREGGSRVYGVEIFPWGIPFPDIYRVRVQQEFQELAQGIR